MIFLFCVILIFIKFRRGGRLCGVQTYASVLLMKYKSIKIRITGRKLLKEKCDYLCFSPNDFLFRVISVPAIAHDMRIISGIVAV